MSTVHVPLGRCEHRDLTKQHSSSVVGIGTVSMFAIGHSNGTRLGNPGMVVEKVYACTVDALINTHINAKRVMSETTYVAVV